MRRALKSLFMLSVTVSASQADAAEPIAPGVPYAPATHSVAVVDARAIALNQYFYIDFPRQMKTLQNEKELAEAELALIARRVENYRPFRSFGRYAPTYTADQTWQIALIAAKHRLECLRNDEADLWRERRLAAGALAVEMARRLR